MDTNEREQKPTADWARPVERCLALVLRSLGEVGSFSKGGCEAEGSPPRVFTCPAKSNPNKNGTSSQHVLLQVRYPPPANPLRPCRPLGLASEATLQGFAPIRGCSFHLSLITFPAPSLFARVHTTVTRGLRTPAARIQRHTSLIPMGARPVIRQ
jgi:hypothetical protein